MSTKKKVKVAALFAEDKSMPHDNSLRPAIVDIYSLYKWVLCVVAECPFLFQNHITIT
jgi:hypothetical protein